MKRTTIILALLFALTTNAHAKKYVAPIEEPIERVEQLPTFNGEDYETFKRWLSNKIYYPINDIKGLAYKGSSFDVEVEFVVERSGSISSINIVGSPAPKVSTIIERALESAPKLSPAVSGGSPVRFKTSLTIGFTSEIEMVHSDNKFFYRKGVRDLNIEKISGGRGFNFAVNVSRDSETGVANMERAMLIYHGRAGYNDINNVTSEKRIYSSVQVTDLISGKSAYSDDHFSDYSNIHTLPRLVDGRAYVEYLDWLVGELSKVEGLDITPNKIPQITIFHGVDGTPAILSMTTPHNNASTNRAIKRVLSASPRFTPALLDGEPIGYKHTLVLSAEYLKGRKGSSFAQEVRESIADNTPINFEFVDCLPTYKGGAIANFESELSAKVKQNAPSSKGSVNLSITVEKDGSLGYVEVLSSSDQKLKLTTINTLVAMPQQWTPAKVYGEEVACTIYLTISI